MIAFLIFMQISCLFSETIGFATRTGGKQFCSNDKFQCGIRGCIPKNKWCDGIENCDDSSDETFCGYNNDYYDTYTSDCDSDYYFRCQSSDMCIPKSGYCDGYTSCPDQSDELNCTCVTYFDEEGIIHNTASIGNYQTQQMCWILVIPNNRYLNLSIQAKLQPRNCEEGNITAIFTSHYIHFPVVLDDVIAKEYQYIVCPAKSATKTSSNIIIKGGDIKIRYRSSLFTSSNNLFDIFTITYSMVDQRCLNPDSFKCSEKSCILREKLCDGNEDCENGIDEQNCDFTSFAAAKLGKNLKNVTNWMRSQHNADWGWKENTGRAVVALSLGNALDFKNYFYEDDLIAKQLELEVSTHLFRSNFRKISPTELSIYINALLAICHNPKNFFGFDLVQKLKEEIEKEPDYIAPFPYLTLCNAKEVISSEVVSRLLQILEKSPNQGFIFEVQALAIMALSCIPNDDSYVYLTQNITEALNNIKLQQREDGSFGNEYTTALVLQAFAANDKVFDEDWNFKSAFEFLSQKQRDDGSFGNFLTTYLVMPLFNAKSLVDIGKVNCTKNMIRPKGGNLVSDIQSRQKGKNPVKYSLITGDEKEQIHPIYLRVPKNITANELMVLAADIDPKYKFKTHVIKKKAYVYEILNIPNDPENNKFWLFYRNTGNDTIRLPTQAVEEIHVQENDHLIMWYKTLSIL